MLSENAIKKLNEILKKWQEIVNIEDKTEREIEMSLYMEDMPFEEIKTVLNLITKLQKENEEKDKQIEKYLNKRISDVEKCYNEMLTDIGGIKVINITGLSKKEKEEVINKRNCLLVQKYCYQEILENLAKEKDI